MTITALYATLLGQRTAEWNRRGLVNESTLEFSYNPSSMHLRKNVETMMVRQRLPDYRSSIRTQLHLHQRILHRQSMEVGEVPNIPQEPNEAVSRHNLATCCNHLT